MFCLINENVVWKYDLRRFCWTVIYECVILHVCVCVVCVAEEEGGEHQEEGGGAEKEGGRAETEAGGSEETERGGGEEEGTG